MPWLRTPLPWCALALLLLGHSAAAPPAERPAGISDGTVSRPTVQADACGATGPTPRREPELVVDSRTVVRLQADPAGESAPTRKVRVRPLISARPYAGIIEEASERHGVDPRIVHALIEIESGYRPDATSPKGAAGLMQLMPATVTRYAVADPFDPEDNVNAGTHYLRSLLDEFGLRAALAAYNAGEGAVRRFDGVPPYRETRRYVSRVLALVDEWSGDAVGN